MEIRNIAGDLLFTVQHANLQGANLHGANLHGADLQYADLRDANLHGADLHGADLRGADLRDANLQYADLRGANLQYADLRGANLRGAHNISSVTQARLSIVPERGAFMGCKQCQGGVLVWLSIPSDAKRSNATGRKCRAEFADVVEIIGGTEGISIYDSTTVYRVGERVTCNQWEADRWVECGGGIHFYLTEEEAKAN